MASHLGEIFGTELDKVNCPFYFKMGACRHGDKCSRLHNQPVVSQTILIPHMYLNPAAAPMMDEHGKPIEYDRRFLRDHFEEFYEDTFEELSKYGEVEELQIVDNVCEHLLGNVYVRYNTEDQAENALKNLQGRYYAGRLLTPEFSPVTDFRDARCRQYEEDECTRGGLCNFMHLKHVSRSLKKELQKIARKKRSRSRSGEREDKKKRKDDRDRERSDRGDRDRKDDRDRERKDDRKDDRDRERKSRREDERR